jgi:Leucine-rich repeat (LRR) protein
VILCVLLIPRDVFGRQLECEYDEWAFSLWPFHTYCSVDYLFIYLFIYLFDLKVYIKHNKSSLYLIIDSPNLAAEFESEKHTFSDPASHKSETKNLEFLGPSNVDFIPLDIFTEFPHLNGLIILYSILPVLNSGFFKLQFQKLEYLDLQYNKIELIEPKAFEYLNKLKWVSLKGNKLQMISHNIFENNTELIYIDLSRNRINSVHPNFFDSFSKLKFVKFEGNHCIQSNIGCKNLQNCYDNCLNDTLCYTSLTLQNPQFEVLNVLESRCN